MAHKQRDAKKEALWRRRVRGQARSGMTIRAWCLSEQVNEATFHWWRRELARRDGERRKSAVPKRKHRRVSRSPAFVPVRVNSTDSRVRPTDPGVSLDAPQAVSSHIEIALSDGRRIRVIGQVDRQALADVLAALERSAC
jgi:hypothetical protein